LPEPLIQASLKAIERHHVSIPTLGFGTWQLNGDTCVEATMLALGTGYRHIDTAQIYENEQEVGQAIINAGVPRDKIFLTTKSWMRSSDPKAFTQSIDESLKKLRTDYVDLLLLHRPVPEIPLSLQIETLQEMQRQGKARLIGVSNYATQALHQIIYEYGVKLFTNQVEYHPFLAQGDMMAFARDHDMCVTAWRPLANGCVKKHPVLKTIAEKYAKNEGQIALRWLIQQGNVSAIPKATSAAHIKGNIDIYDFTLTEMEMAAIFTLADHANEIHKPGWAPLWNNKMGKDY
jgi:diketogulonate reductase-like aldo/keto reductase